MAKSGSDHWRVKPKEGGGMKKKTHLEGKLLLRSYPGDWSEPGNVKDPCKEEHAVLQVGWEAQPAEGMESR